MFCLREMFMLHGVSESIISDHSTQFTSQLQKFVDKGLCTHVKISTTFHPQTDGQVEHTIQTLEDMFRDYLIDFKNNWNVYFTLIELAHNNNYVQLFL